MGRDELVLNRPVMRQAGRREASREKSSCQETDPSSSLVLQRTNSFEQDIIMGTGCGAGWKDCDVDIVRSERSCDSRD